MNVDNPYDVSGSTGGGGSPSLDTYRARNSSSGFTNYWDQIMGKSPARQLELLGGTPGAQRVEQNEPRYEDWSTVPYVVQDVPQPDERGVVSRAMDYLLRPASAIAGVATAFLGRDRYTADKDELGDAMLSSRAETALVRFMQGITGEVRYNFADFTPIAKKKSEGIEVPFYQNVANVTGGFVVDTAFDPLTYVSFGGNLYGRRLGAKYVGGRVQQVADDVVASPGFNPDRFLLQTYESKRASAITSAALATKMDRLRLQALVSNTIQNPADRALLANAVFNPESSVEDLLQTMRRVSTDEIDFAREIAREWMPDAAAMQYWTGSARALRKWLIRTMGIDEGMDFYRALPKDIQGGLRIRVPFMRKDGVPIAQKLTPGGGGQIAEALSKRGFKGMEKLLDMNERGRDVFRNFFFGSTNMRRLFSQGKFTDIAYDAIIQATGKRNTPGRTAFVTYGEFERNYWKAIVAGNEFNTRQAAMRIATYEQYAENAKGLSLEEQRAVSREIFLYLSDRPRLAADIADPSNLTQAQKLALAPAASAEQLLNSYGDEIISLGINEKTLKNFAMRQKTRRRRAREALNKEPFAQPGGGKAETFKADRNAHVFEWKYNMNEGAKVARWKIADDILEVIDGEWENPYVTDFITSLYEYAEDVQRTLDSWRIAKIFTEAGILTPKARESLATYNTSLIEREMNELVGQSQPGALQPLKKKILDEFFEGASDVPFDLTDQRLRNYVIAQSQEGMSIFRARALRSELAEEVPGVVSRERYDIYSSQGPGKKDSPIKEIFGTDLDNTTIYLMKDGTYQLKDEFNNLISTHRTLGEASERARLEFMALRDGKFNNKIVEEAFDILDKIDDLIYFNVGQVRGYSALGGRAWSPDTGRVKYDARWGIERYINELPAEEAEAARRVINQRALDLVRIFRPDMPKIEFDKFGNIVTGGQPYAHMEQPVKEWFRNFVERESWADMMNQVYRPDGTLDDSAKMVMQQRVVARMEDVVAPRVVMDTYVRMHEAILNPENFWNTIYQPTYTAIRSMMTIQRGPGFAGRNYMGGSWNAYLFGVGKQHQVDSGKVLIARRRTRTQLLEKYGDEAFRDPQIRQEMADTFKSELERLFDGTGNYIKGVKDSDAMFEMWDLAYNADIVGGSRAGRLIGETLLRAPFVTPRLGSTSIQRPFDRLGKLEDYVDVASTMGGSQSANLSERMASMLDPEKLSTRYAQAMQYIATENKWVRQYMGPLSANVEDQLRFASFLKGVQDFGLEPAETGLRGYTASTLVKITQFDYSDLSPWELNFFKNLLPFWVWTRNNVPLQVRSAINNPRRIAKIGRAVEAAQSLFQTEPEGPVPGYADNQFNIYIDPSYWDGAPKFLRPILPSGVVGISPVPFLDPLVDLNRWFRTPSSGNPNPLNWQELANNINPMLVGIADLFGVISGGRDYAGRDYKEAPKWMELIPGATEPDPMDPAVIEGSQNVRNAVTTVIPTIGLFERYAPWFFGDERQEGKWITTMVSALTGITISTIDDLQISNEMTRDIERIKWYTDRKWGPSAEPRIEMIRQLLEEGAPLWFIESIDIGNLPENEIDVERAVQAWKYYRSFEESYIAMTQGVDDPEARISIANELARPYLQYLTEEQRRKLTQTPGLMDYFRRDETVGDFSRNITPGIWDYLGESGFRGDFSRGVRAGAWQPPKTEEIEEVGYSRREIDRLFSIAESESSSEEEKTDAMNELKDVHEAIALNRRIGMFTIFGTRVEGWEPEDE